MSYLGFVGSYFAHDQRVCLSACVSACPIALSQSYTRKLCRLSHAWCLWSWLGHPLATVRCTSGFADDVMFADNGQALATEIGRAVFDEGLGGWTPCENFWPPPLLLLKNARGVVYLCTYALARSSTSIAKTSTPSNEIWQIQPWK